MRSPGVAASSFLPAAAAACPSTPAAPGVPASSASPRSTPQHAAATTRPVAAGESGRHAPALSRNPLGPTPRLPRTSARPAAAAAVAHPRAAAAAAHPRAVAAAAAARRMSQFISDSEKSVLNSAAAARQHAASSRGVFKSDSSKRNAAAAATGHTAAAPALSTARENIDDQREDAHAEDKQSDEGSDVRTLEEAVEDLVEAGAVQMKKRLRLSSIRSSARPLYLARLPEPLSGLQQPVSIQQDIISLTAGEKLPQHLQEAARRAAPWRLRDSADVSAAASGKTQKLFLSKPNDVNSDCFFILVEGKEYTEVLPVDGWINFERCAPSRGLHALPRTADDAEEQSRSKAAKEEALAARIAQLRRRSRGTEEDSRMRRANSSIFLAPSGSRSEDLSSQNTDELGLRRQRQKRMKQLLRQKAGQTGRVNEYIDSALSLTTLRHAEVDWDYEEGERSDDEDDLAMEGKQQQGGADPGDLYGAAAAGEALSDEEDATGLSAADLTNYGQKMKDLLDKAKDDEADDELHQYECDDDEDEGGAERGGGTENGRGVAAAAAAVRGGAVAAAGIAPAQRPAAAGGGSSRAAESIQDLEHRVIRVMQQHMGRMSVKTFMTAFKVREKNEEFKRIQQIVHKICKMETTEEKQKFIILKPEYRM